MKMRLILTFFIAGFFVGASMAQSARPFLEIGKRDRNDHALIRPIYLDSSTSGALYFRTAATPEWKRVGTRAHPLKPLFMSEPLLNQDFRRFQNVKAGAAVCAVVAALSFITLSISGVRAFSYSYPEYPAGVTPEHTNPARYMIPGSLVATIGSTIGALHLRKKSRRQLVNLINDYNDPTLSTAPIREKGCSWRFGLADSGNAIGMGLRLRPN